jgi:hypothetical protein
MAAKTRKAPDFSGVPGELIKLSDDSDVSFGRKLRGSPYDPLLIRLRDAGSGHALKFGDARARTSVAARARKLDIDILCGEKDGVLYVKLAGAAQELPSPLADARKTNRHLVMEAIRAGKKTPAAIAAWIRDNGNPTMDAGIVTSILGNLQKDGSVKCTSIAANAWAATEVKR